MRHRETPERRISENLPKIDGSLIIPRAPCSRVAFWGVDLSTRRGQRLLRRHETVEALVDALAHIRPLLVGIASFLVSLLISYLIFSR